MGNLIGDASQISAYIAGSYSNEIPLALSVKTGEQYYLIRLRKLITASLLRFGSVYFLFAFFFFGMFIFPLIPLFIIVSYKYYLFLQYQCVF